jgi:hypothetical protein
MKNLFLVLSVFTAGAMLAACGHDHDRVSMNDDARGKYESVTVSFPRGSAVIPTSDINHLQSVAGNLKSSEHLDSVTAAVWSDEEFPAARDHDLAKPQRDLAKARIDAIRDAIRPYKGITAHNMAEHASWYARAVNSDGAELESLFSKRDPDAMDRNDFNLIKSNGGPGKAVVVFERK